MAATGALHAQVPGTPQPMRKSGHGSDSSHADDPADHDGDESLSPFMADWLAARAERLSERAQWATRWRSASQAGSLARDGRAGKDSAEDIDVDALSEWSAYAGSEADDDAEASAIEVAAQVEPPIEEVRSEVPAALAFPANPVSMSLPFLAPNTAVAPALSDPAAAAAAPPIPAAAAAPAPLATAPNAVTLGGGGGGASLSSELSETGDASGIAIRAPVPIAPDASRRSSARARSGPISSAAAPGAALGPPSSGLRADSAKSPARRTVSASGILALVQRPPDRERTSCGGADALRSPVRRAAADAVPTSPTSPTKAKGKAAQRTPTRTLELRSEGTDGRAGSPSGRAGSPSGRAGSPSGAGSARKGPLMAASSPLRHRADGSSSRAAQLPLGADYDEDMLPLDDDRPSTGELGGAAPSRSRSGVISSTSDPARERSGGAAAATVERMPPLASDAGASLTESESSVVLLATRTPAARTMDVAEDDDDEDDKTEDEDVAADRARAAAKAATDAEYDSLPPPHPPSRQRWGWSQLDDVTDPTISRRSAVPATGAGTGTTAGLRSAAEQSAVPVAPAPGKQARKDAAASKRAGGPAGKTDAVSKRARLELGEAKQPAHAQPAGEQQQQQRKEAPPGKNKIVPALALDGQVLPAAAAEKKRRTKAAAAAPAAPKAKAAERKRVTWQFGGEAPPPPPPPAHAQAAAAAVNPQPQLARLGRGALLAPPPPPVTDAWRRREQPAVEETNGADAPADISADAVPPADWAPPVIPKAMSKFRSVAEQVAWVEERITKATARKAKDFGGSSSVGASGAASLSSSTSGPLFYGMRFVILSPYDKSIFNWVNRLYQHGGRVCRSTDVLFDGGGRGAARDAGQAPAAQSAPLPPVSQTLFLVTAYAAARCCDELRIASLATLGSAVVPVRFEWLSDSIQAARLLLDPASSRPPAKYLVATE